MYKYLMLPKVVRLSHVFFENLMLENVSEMFGVTRGAFHEIIHPNLNFDRWTRVMGKMKIIPLGIVLLLLQLKSWNYG